MIPLPLGDITGTEAEVVGPDWGLPVAVEPDPGEELPLLDPPATVDAGPVVPVDTELAGDVAELPAGFEPDDAEDGPVPAPTLIEDPDPAKVVTE